MATIVRVLEGQDVAFGRAEWAAFESMAGNTRDPVPGILREWLEDHGWAGISRPRPGNVTWQEAVLARYLAASGGVRMPDDIMTDTPVRNFNIVARMEQEGLIRAVPVSRKTMGYPANGYALTDAGAALAADLASQRSGGQVPRELRDDLAATWGDAGEALVTRRLWIPEDDWHAAEAAAESVWVSVALLIRGVVRAWMKGRGWNAPVHEPDPETVRRVLGSLGGHPGRVLREMTRTPRSRRAVPELGATLKIGNDLIYPVIYALERRGWVSRRSRPPGYVITPEGVQAASRAALVPAFGENKTLPQWAADPRCKVSEATLRQRVAAGESAEAAMSRGPGPQGRRRGQATSVYPAFGEEKTLSRWAADPRCKVSEATLRQRVAAGEDAESAMGRPARPARTLRGEPAPAQDGEPTPDDLSVITAWLDKRRARWSR